MDKLRDNSKILAVYEKDNDDSVIKNIIPERFHNSMIFSSLAEISNKEGKNVYDAIVLHLNTAIKNQDNFYKPLKKSLELLKQEGLLLIKNDSSYYQQVELDLKINGYLNVSITKDNIIGYKPKYDIGSSQKINFSKKSVAEIWKLDDTVDDDIDIIDPDNLLDDEDFKKPEASSLRVCGTTGQRKACKDCSCGLAEELENEGKQTQAPAVRSSCGNCYLGDAFRCASCPYLGMPAFKPGEKIQLSENQLVN